MNKIATIKYNQSFLKLTNKIVQNNNVMIRECVDIHPYTKAPIFINCNTIFFEKCDKNMIYYWMNTFTFPNVNNIYLLKSHPCDPTVFYRFHNTDTKIYLSQDYLRYKNRWAEGNDNVII